MPHVERCISPVVFWRCRRSQKRRRLMCAKCARLSHPCVCEHARTHGFIVSLRLHTPKAQVLLRTYARVHTCVCSRAAHPADNDSSLPPISTGTGFTRPHRHRGLGSPAATSAPGLGSPRPHLYRDWAHPAHICTGTGSIQRTTAPASPPTPLETRLLRHTGRTQITLRMAHVVPCMLHGARIHMVHAVRCTLHVHAADGSLRAVCCGAPASRRRHQRPEHPCSAHMRRLSRADVRLRCSYG